jgi:hypothetical protein
MIYMSHDLLDRYGHICHAAADIQLSLVKCGKYH